MKVAFVDQTGDDIGGAQLSLALLLRNLASSIDPHAVFFHDGAFAESVRKLGIPTDIVGLGTSSSTSTRERPNVGAALELPKTAQSIARVIRSRGSDVVHTNSVKAHVFGGVAARIAHRPSLAHLRDILSGFGLFGVRTTLATCSSERIAISAQVAHCFKLARTTVVKNPLDLSLYDGDYDRVDARRRLGIPIDERPLIAIVGRINRWKGQDRFLRALAIVNATLPVRGLIVGSPVFRDADFLPELHALRDALGLADAVSFCDWVDDPRSVYAAIDIHVNASTQEPFGRTTIESAAMNVPTVCFDDSGVAETMLDGETGIVVPAGDVEALASGILRYAQDSGARTSAGRAAREWSHQFDARVHGRIVSAILTRVATRTQAA